MPTNPAGHSRKKRVIAMKFTSFRAAAVALVLATGLMGAIGTASAQSYYYHHHHYQHRHWVHDHGHPHGYWNYY
jgi:hypothetical protein